MDLVEIGWRVVNWIGLVQDRDNARALADAVKNLRVPLDAGKFSSDYTTVGLSCSAKLHRDNEVWNTYYFLYLWDFYVKRGIFL
jgi:hypothetical protein